MMLARTITQTVFALLIVVAVSTSAGTAFAQSAASIAVVDINVVMRDSSAAKGVRTQMQSLLDKFQKWGKGQQDKYVAEGQKLQKQQSILAQDQLLKQQQALQKKVATFEGEARKREQKIRQAGANAQQAVDKMLTSVVSEVAKKQGVAIVLPRSVTVYSGKVKDITKEVLALMNQKLPTLAVNVPK